MMLLRTAVFAATASFLSTAVLAQDVTGAGAIFPGTHLFQVG
jgi:hypothetical protein